MQKVQGSKPESRRPSVILLGALLLFAPLAALGAGDEKGSTVLTGVVRDAHGVAQMGVLVQVLAPGAGAIGSAFTDEHGRYTISHLLAGRYRVLATANLFAPASRPVLQLGDGAHAVVDLTLAALFDTASWLPAERRRDGEPDDDWKWTLRSSASRPILRFEDESPVPSTPEGGGGHRALHGSLSVVGANGLLAASAVQEAVVLEQQLSTGTKATYRLVSAASPAGPTEVAAGWVQTAANGQNFSTLIRFRSQPQFQAGLQSGGQDTVSIVSARQIALGERGVLEAGGNLTIIRAASDILRTERPFLRLVVAPGAGWRVQYRVATARGQQGYADVRADQDSVESQPQADAVLAATSALGRLETEAGVHQELSLTHEVGAGTLQLGCYHDGLKRVLLSGTGASRAASSVLTRRGSDQFAVLADGYTTTGAAVAYTLPLREGLWLIAEYAVGDALTVDGKPPASAEQALAGVRARGSQTAAIALRGRVRQSGTQVRTSYRWHPEGDISPVNAFDSMTPEAFLGLFVRQQLRLGSWAPAGLEGTLNISNLLAQGYRPFLSEDGQTLYLAQTPRTVQVGLAFNF